MKEENTSTKIYELGFHILPTVPEEKLAEAVLGLEECINKNGGTIISSEFPKLKILSYDIKKREETKYLSFSKAYFGWVKFEIDSAAIGKIDKEVSENKSVLRFIIVKTVKENTISSKIIPAKEVQAPKPVGEKIEISEEEIDRSIDELVDQNLEV